MGESKRRLMIFVIILIQNNGGTSPPGNVPSSITQLAFHAPSEISHFRLNEKFAPANQVTGERVKHSPNIVRLTDSSFRWSFS